MGFLYLICLQGGEDKSIKTMQVGLCRGLPHHNTEWCTLQFTPGLSLPALLPSKEVSLTILKEGGGGEGNKSIGTESCSHFIWFPLK